MSDRGTEQYQRDNWLAAGRVLRGVAHGVNNQLGAILAYADLIAQSAGVSKDTATMAREISSAVRECTAQIDTAAALVSDDLETIETIHLNVILPRIAAMFRFEFDRDGRRMRVELTDKTCAFPGVRTRVYRALAHTIRAAAELARARGQGWTLRVVLEPRVQQFVIRIEGVGDARALPAGLEEAQAHVAYHDGRMTCLAAGEIEIEFPRENSLLKK